MRRQSRLHWKTPKFGLKNDSKFFLRGIAVREFDLRGLKCPMPVLRVKKVLKDADSQEVVAFLTDDPHAPEDIRVFSQQSGHTVVSQTENNGVVRNELRRRAPAS